MGANAAPVDTLRTGLSALAASIAVAALSVTAAGAALPLAPLSTLGKLTPAPAGSPGPEGVPVPKTQHYLAPPQTVKLNEAVDGIRCQRLEHFAYHIHVHLTVFVHGKAYAVPLGIGIGPPLSVYRFPTSLKIAGLPTGLFVAAGSCFMWLHTHAFDGVIHIESPTRSTYVLGQFFAVWGQPLSRSRLGPFSGKVTAFYDGKVWTGDPGTIPLTSETQVQLDLGSPVVAPVHIVFPTSLSASCENAAGKVSSC